MQFPGYWVVRENNKISIEATLFDETELSVESNWKEAWQNTSNETNAWGYIDLRCAINQVKSLMK